MILVYLSGQKAPRKFFTALRNPCVVWWPGEDSPTSLFTLIIGATREQCQLAYDTLLQLLLDLGISISDHKLVAPTQRLTFLGVQLDTTACTMTLPDDKLAELLEQVIEFQNKQRATKKQLQRLAGKLNWADRVVYGAWRFCDESLTPWTLSAYLGSSGSTNPFAMTSSGGFISLKFLMTHDCFLTTYLP